jgi:hypothetical protein
MEMNKKEPEVDLISIGESKKLELALHIFASMQKALQECRVPITKID